MACMGENRKTYRSLVGKRRGKRPLVILRCRQEHTIKMDLKEIG